MLRFVFVKINIGVIWRPAYCCAWTGNQPGVFQSFRNHHCVSGVPRNERKTTFPLKLSEILVQPNAIYHVISRWKCSEFGISPRRHTDLTPQTIHTISSFWLLRYLNLKYGKKKLRLFLGFALIKKKDCYILRSDGGRSVFSYLPGV